MVFVSLYTSFVWNKKTHTHTGRAETLCALTWVRARKHWHTEHLTSRRCCHGFHSHASTKRKKKGGGVWRREAAKSLHPLRFVSLFLRPKRSPMSLLWWFDDDKSPELTFWPFTNSQAERFNRHVWLMEDDWKDFNDSAVSWCPAALQHRQASLSATAKKSNQSRMRVCFFYFCPCVGKLFVPAPHRVMAVPQKLHLSFDIVVSVPRAYMKPKPSPELLSCHVSPAQCFTWILYRKKTNKTKQNKAISSL